jgi:2-polyprenyl-3-methyl-5-hydroxy-6-metoxy-1,4-benzoquinol methylase
MLSSLREMLRQRRNRKEIYSSEAYWDSKAQAYDDSRVSMWPNQALNRLYENEQCELIDRQLGRVDGLKLLDLGCGAGRFSRRFAAQGAQVTGVDFSSGALAVARRHSVGGNPTYRQGSVFGLSDKDVYDVIFVLGVLTVACLDRNQLLDALIRLKQALRTNGRLLLTEPIHRGFLHRVLEMNLSEFLSVMRQAGFKIETVSPLHFWPVRLALAYIPWPKWVTALLYYFGQTAMKLPGFSSLGDYWSISASPIHNVAPEADRWTVQISSTVKAH